MSVLHAIASFYGFSEWVEIVGLTAYTQVIGTAELFPPPHQYSSPNEMNQ